MDQVTAVKHALLHAQYLELEQRTQFPVALLQQLAEDLGFNLAAVERHVYESMKAVAAAFARESERQLLEGFTGGGPGGGKQAALDYRVHHPQGIIRAPRGVSTCVA